LAKGRDEMTKHYEQRKESNKRYLSKFDEVKFRVPKGQKEFLKERADKYDGGNLTAFICRAIAETIRRDEGRA
jgi:hypothetical protein